MTNHKDKPREQSPDGQVVVLTPAELEALKGGARPGPEATPEPPRLPVKPG